MKISLNGHPLAREAHGGTKIATVVEELQSEIHESGRLLLRIIVDGVPLNGEWRNDFRLQVPASSVRLLELVIDEPARVALQMLTDSRYVLNRLASRTTPLARSFRVGNEVVANSELAAFLDDLKLVLSSLKLSTEHVADVPALKGIRSRMESSATNLLPALERIQQAQSLGDPIAIADEIQYELPGQMQVWQELVNEAHRLLKAEAMQV